MKTFAFGVPLLALACSAHIENERPLSAEREMRVGELLEDEPVATAMVVELADRMLEGTVDAQGNPVSREQLIASIEYTTSWLQAEYVAGRIMEADIAEFPVDDAAGMYDDETSAERTDDRIVLVADTEMLSLDTLVHEAGHEKFRHDVFVLDDIREAGAEYNAGFADVIIEHKDYSYLLSSLYTVPADMLRANREAIAEAKERAQEAAEAGDLRSAVAQMKEDLTMRTPDEAEAHIREVYATQIGMFEQYSGSEDDLVEAYFASGMYDALSEARAEAIKEFRSEYTKEATHEVRMRRF